MTSKKKTLKHKAEEGENKEEKPHFSTGTFLGLKHWRDKSAGVNTLQTFANDELHYKLLQQNLENVHVEVPMPMKMQLFDEVYPIMKTMVASYEKALGKSHELTMQVKERLEELDRLGQLFEGM